VIINLIILLIKLGLRINSANYFKDQRRHPIRLTSVMFHETPWLPTTKSYLDF